MTYLIVLKCEDNHTSHPYDTKKYNASILK